MNEQLDQSEANRTMKTPPQRRAGRAGNTAHSARHIRLDDEEDSIFARHRIKIIIVIAVALGTGAAFLIKPGKGLPAQKAPERIVSIQLPPLPPPPPPPKKVPPPPPKEQKMIEQAPVAEQEKPAEQPKPKQAAPAAPLGTGLKGDGPGLAGLGGSGDGGGVFGGTGSGVGGSRWGYFASEVQSRVTEALRNNKTTNNADLKIKVHIWANSAGRVTRAKLDGSTGDNRLDNAIQNEVLTGLQLKEPPPSGMPMPIVMRLSIRRP